MGVKKLNTRTIKLITVYALKIYEHKLLIFGSTYLLTFISLLRTFFFLSLGLYIEPFFTIRLAVLTKTQVLWVLCGIKYVYKMKGI